MKLLRTTSENSDFKYLTNLFDTYLLGVDGEESNFFAQFNQIYFKNVVLCYENDIPVGCGAFKEYEPKVAEIKRMFVIPEARKKGIASKIILELENWAKENNYTNLILETSFKLENAIALYQKFGFKTTENYGQYIGVASCVCMKKTIQLQ